MIKKTKISKGAAQKVSKRKPLLQVKAETGKKKKFQHKKFEASDSPNERSGSFNKKNFKQKFAGNKNSWSENNQGKPHVKPKIKIEKGESNSQETGNSGKKNFKRKFASKKKGWLGEGNKGFQQRLNTESSDKASQKTDSANKKNRKRKFTGNKKGQSTENNQGFQPKVKVQKVELNDTSSQGTTVAGKKNFKRKFTGNKKSGPSGEKVKLFNLKKRERKLIRKKIDHAPTFDRGVRLKILWEQLREGDCPPQRKSVLLQESIKLIKGHAKELSYAHDTVRVLEWIFNLGTDEHKTVLFDELKDDMINLVKSKYGKFFWIKVLQHGSKSQKNHVMREFYGKVTALLCHTEASAVVEVAFNECANATQRAELVQEFYGPSYRYFKESNCHSLKQLLEKFPEQKTAIIQNMKESITKLLKKSVVRHSIIHFVLYEFLSHADHECAREVIESLRDVAVQILHTKEGSRAAMHCLWHGTAKDRKAIIKSFKTHVVKIANEEHGHMVLLALFDCVDDTKLVEKHVISELVKNLSDVVVNACGRKVLLYLLAPRDTVVFHPDIIKILEEGDKNETSKKDPVIRRSELKQTVVAPLIQYVVDNVGTLYTDNSCCVTMLTILKHTEGAQQDAYKAIADVASNLYSAETRNTHIIESPGSSFMLKKLITDDKIPDKKVLFSEVLVQEVPVDTIRSWTLCNRGCFLLVSLLETEIPSVVEKIKEAMQGHRKQLSKKPFKGAEILMKKLKQ